MLQTTSNVFLCHPSNTDLLNRGHILQSAWVRSSRICSFSVCVHLCQYNDQWSGDMSSSSRNENYFEWDHIRSSGCITESLFWWYWALWHFQAHQRCRCPFSSHTVRRGFDNSIGVRVTALEMYLLRLKDLTFTWCHASIPSQAWEASYLCKLMRVGWLHLARKRTRNVLSSINIIRKHL